MPVMVYRGPIPSRIKPVPNLCGLPLYDFKTSSAPLYISQSCKHNSYDKGTYLVSSYPWFPQANLFARLFNCSLPNPTSTSRPNWLSTTPLSHWQTSFNAWTFSKSLTPVQATRVNMKEIEHNTTFETSEVLTTRINLQIHNSIDWSGLYHEVHIPPCW